jgi:ABC-type lipoprotein export system ATPase subunit
VNAPVLPRLCVVSKRFVRGSETIHAVVGVSLTPDPAMVTVVGGPSGSGKTTLLNLLIGWESPDEGVVEGLPTRPDWTQIAIVPQRLGLMEHLTVAENVGLPLRARRRHGRGDADRVAALLAAAGIDGVAHRFPAETSLGEQQRAACARALITRPRLVVADEPTSHQDEGNGRRIIDLLLAEAARGAAVVVATHDERVAVHAGRRFEMLDGRLLPMDAADRSSAAPRGGDRDQWSPGAM